MLKLIGFGLLIYLAMITAIVVDSFSNKDVKAQYAIVLGNQVTRDGIPSARLAARLDGALDIYNQGRVSKIIVSGGIGKEGFDEANVMADYLIVNGIPKSNLVIDNQGYNTNQTAKFTSEYITDKATSIIGISQQYHISRVKLSLKNAGFINVHGYYPKYYEWRDPYSYTREIAAWAKYWIMDL